MSDTTTVEVQVSLDAVRAAVSHAVAEAFMRPQWSSKTGGWAYQAAQEAVQQYVARMDWPAIVAAAVEKELHTAVAEAVEKELKRHAAAQVKLRLAGGG